jgi:hypothetical protein
VTTAVDALIAALARQQNELSGLLNGLADADWHTPTRCAGWDVADVVLHLVQTDEMAIGSATGRFADVVAELTGGELLGVTLPPTDRLRPIARLAWRTLPYAFASAGRTLTGPVAFRLVSPGGETWDFLPGEPAVTTIWGSAVELCAVAARRLDASVTSLRGEGPDCEDVLGLVRTYA